MTSTIIYHDNCPDGWTAAWVAYNALKGSGEGAPQLIPASYGNPMPDLDGVDTVYLVDFSYPHTTLRAMADHHRVVVLDHHRSAIDDICSGHGDDIGQAPWGEGARGDKWVARYSTWYNTVLDDNRSGAGIAWDYFHPGEDRPWLVDYVEDRDLWRFNLPNSKAVNAAIRCGHYDLGTWDDWHQLLDPGVMANNGYGVLAHIDAYCRAAAGHAYWCVMGDRRFPIVNVTYESCSEVADYLLDHFGVDMAGYFFHRGDGSWQYGFRSRNGTTVHDHAAAFGGGGHPQAAGCTVKQISHEKVDPS